MATVLQAILPLATSGLLVCVGILIHRRRAEAEDRLALRLFAIWWFSAALIVLLDAAPTLLSLAGVERPAAYRAAFQLISVPVAVGLCCLLFYLVYVYTGRRAAIWPLAVTYLLFFAFEVYYMGQFSGHRIEETPWAVRAVPTELPSHTLRIVFGLVVAVPILSAIVGYGLLLPHAPQGEPRYRVALVSGAFALWFLPVLVAFVAGYDQAAWFPLAYQLPGLVAASLILAAFRPPRAVARRWAG